MDLLKARKDNLKSLWADGAFSGVSSQEMAIRNSAAVGACSAYDDILNIDYQSLNGDSND